jgi:hypothetical protein
VWRCGLCWRRSSDLTRSLRPGDAADDRWQIGDRVRLGWHREQARVLR